MTHKLLLITVLTFTLFAEAQNLKDEELMGEWKAVNVEIPNAEDVPQKEALKFIEDAFFGSIFNFKGNRIFKIEYGTAADERIKELFFLDNKNWKIKGNQILIGTENDDFSSMHIIVKTIDEKIFFVLPMIQLEMEKITNDKPSEPKWVASKVKKIESTTVSKLELINKEIDNSLVIEFNELENPPLAPECKVKWDAEKKKKCTNGFVNKHVSRKFNTDLAVEKGVKGKLKINIEFVIDTNGKPINITATGGPEIINQHAIEIISLLPEFLPGTKNGKPINVLYKMPLIFQVVE